jgi:flagellar basal-body rod protein FlgF
MLTGEHRQDVIANNLANVATAGFKRDLAVFQERFVESQVAGSPADRHGLLDRMTGGVLAAPTFVDHSDSALQRTQNPLDVAIRGDGFFAVQDGGEVRYTRDGRFDLDVEGRLVSKTSGAAILDQTGNPIVLQPGKIGDIRIDSDGGIYQGGVQTASLALVSFDDKQALAKAGAGQFRAPGQSEQISSATVVQGAVESSNARAIDSLAEMMHVNRAFELNAELLKLQNETLSRAVNDVARLA